MEIKFRAKSVKSGEWIYSPAISPQVFMFPKKEGSWWMFICTDDDKLKCNSGGWIEVIEKTIGQFTGLKDKSGKDIYDGDVVNFSVFDKKLKIIKKKEVVFWQSDFGAFCVGKENGFWALSVDENCEIIGNIHTKKLLSK